MAVQITCIICITLIVICIIGQLGGKKWVVLKERLDEITEKKKMKK